MRQSWILDSRLRISDSRHWFRSLSVKFGFWILIIGGSTDSLNCIPDSKARDSEFHKQKLCRIPDSVIWGEKNVEIKDQEQQINHHGENYGFICTCKVR